MKTPAKQLLEKLQEAEEELENYRAFAERMVREYKAGLVKYIGWSQDRIGEFGQDDSFHRAIILKATSELELSDAELMPLIHVNSASFVQSIDERPSIEDYNRAKMRAEAEAH